MYLFSVSWLPHGLPDFKLSHYLDDTGDCVEMLRTKEKIPVESVCHVGSILMECIDQGPGLSSEQLTQLFGQGVQFNANELQSGGGSGLGLWICKVRQTFCLYINISICCNLS